MEENKERKYLTGDIFIEIVKEAINLGGMFDVGNDFDDEIMKLVLNRVCFRNGEWYEIPYRSLVPVGMKNLLVAGRCISSTHEAQASYRIMPYCAELGQAAGAAISVAAKNNTTLPDVDIKEVQAILRDEDFAI